MKRLTTVLICLYIFQIYSAGQILVSTPSKKLGFNWPLDYPSLTATRGIRSVMFLEYGDGNFTNNPSSLPYAYKTKGNYRSLLQSVVLYDTIKRPPLREAKTLTFPAISSQSDVSSKILGERRILLTPSTSDLVPDEDMVFAVTYRLPAGIKGDILVSYDANESNAFIPLGPVTQTTMYNGTSVEAIRVHHGEMPATDAATKKISFATKNSAGDGIENNVFFNLRSNLVDVINGEVSVARVAVTLTAPGISESYFIDLVIRFYEGHDPNYIVSLPECLEYPAPDHKVFYTVHFENTGSGPVRNSLKIIVQLPEGIQYDKIILDNIRLGESYRVADNIIVRNFPGIIRKNGLIIFHRIENKALILLIREDPSISSTSTKHLLDGKYPGRLISYEKRFGEIKFRTITTTMANRFLIAWASVYFDLLSPEITAPSFTYFSKKCPSDCFYYSK